MLEQVREHLERLVMQPADELRGWQRSARYFIDLVRHCAHRLAKDRAEEMAAALTYRTIFSLIPLFVLGLVIFRPFGGFEDVVQNQIQPRLYEFFGLPDISYTDTGVVTTNDKEPMPEKAPTTDTKAPKNAPGTANGQHDEHDLKSQKQVRASIQKALTELSNKIANVSITSIGFVGAILFIYAGMGLAVSVEYDFNIICDSPRGRPWHLRVPVYWSIITLGTGLLAGSLYFAGEAVEWLGDFGSFAMLQPLLSRMFAFLASWMLLFLLYVTIPNTKVKWRTALIGSFISGAMWETGKWLFQIYVRHAVPYSALYGSLGLLPVFLFWIYCSWMIVLFGLELAFTMQVLQGRVPRRQEENAAPSLPADADWLMPLLAEIAREFMEGRSIGRQQLSERLGLPSRIVNDFAVQLEKHGLIHTMQATPNDVTYVLAFPPNRVRMANVLRLGRALSRSPGKQDDARTSLADWEFVDKLFQAKCAAAGNTTLEQLVDELNQRVKGERTADSADGSGT